MQGGGSSLTLGNLLVDRVDMRCEAIVHAAARRYAKEQALRNTHNLRRRYATQHAARSHAARSTQHTARNTVPAHDVSERHARPERETQAGSGRAECTLRQPALTAHNTPPQVSTANRYAPATCRCAEVYHPPATCGVHAGFRRTAARSDKKAVLWRVPWEQRVLHH